MTKITKKVDVELLYFTDCPSVPGTRELLKSVCASLIPEANYTEIEVRDQQGAEKFAFLGSPTIRINGSDIERNTTAMIGLGCRLYDGEGVPKRWMLEAAILRECLPEDAGFLFLCVANSARSQIAEGVARTLAGKSTSFQKCSFASAGSEPSGRVHPLAIEVLGDVGIDTSGHSSKGLENIALEQIDVVFTLCAEEVCPVFPGKVTRVHWGFPDPAPPVSDDQDLRAVHPSDGFRSVRDQLLHRFSNLFGTE